MQRYTQGRFFVSQSGPLQSEPRDRKRDRDDKQDTSREPGIFAMILTLPILIIGGFVAFLIIVLAYWVALCICVFIYSFLTDTDDLENMEKFISFFRRKKN